ncbi:hypothetical protein V8F06_004823 [Rhypophila decipiens]
MTQVQDQFKGTARLGEESSSPVGRSSWPKGWSVASDWLALAVQKVTPVLIFNRAEAFNEKLAHHPFKQSFPDYAGDEHDIDAIVEYLVGQFNQGVKDPSRGRIPGYVLPANEHGMFEQVVRAIEENVLPLSGDGRVL